MASNQDTLVTVFGGSGFLGRSVVRALANLSLAVYVATTLIGLQLNMREHGMRSVAQKVRWALIWLVCLPVFSLMESIAVAFAIVRPAKDFHVVRK